MRSTFEAAVDSYETARPDYPPELYDTLVQLAHLSPGDTLLEIGCATGKATRHLAEIGFRIVCVELGEDLVAAARRNLEKYAGVEVIRADFETWQAPTDAPFDLVFAATAWHWIDPEIRLRNAWEALRPGGHLAYWAATHVFPDGGDPFFEELQEVYDEIGEGIPPDAPVPYPKPGELDDDRAEIEASGLFSDVRVEHFDWEVIYDADAYLALLDTFSGHIAMEPWPRDRLYGEIRSRLAARPDGMLRRHWGAVLHVARRVG
jgi:SAM-dependent methyltransferase